MKININQQFLCEMSPIEEKLLQEVDTPDQDGDHIQSIFEEVRSLLCYCEA